MMTYSGVDGSGLSFLFWFCNVVP